MGDVAMAVPVVYSLAKTYPHLRITVLSRSFARPFFEDLAPNVSFMEADLKFEYHGVKGLNALFRRLTAKNFTAIADFHNVLRSEYLRLRFNIERYRVAHINKHRKEKRRLTAVNKKRLQQQPTSFRNYAEVLEKLGFPITIEFTSIFPPEGGDISMLPSTIGRKNADEKWIGIAPFAAHEGKVYPPRLMRQVIDKIVEKHPKCRIFLFGKGTQEDETFPQWCDEVAQCTEVSKYLETLKEELILMSHLDLMISMDSANMHLASLTNTPVISIWGATHPYAGFMGWGQTPDRAVQIDLPCRPCSIFGNKPCLRGDYACMRNIAPEQVMERVEIELERQREKTN